jgi:hypothetical protein
MFKGKTQMKFAIIRLISNKNVLCYDYYVESDMSFSGTGNLAKDLRFEPLRYCLIDKEYSLVIFETKEAAESYITFNNLKKEAEVVLLSELE